MSEWEAGPELDAAIAQHVFGLVVYEGLCFHPDDPEAISQIPPYSSDIAAAWTVLEVVTDPKWIGNNTPSQWVRDTPPSRLVSYWWDKSHLWAYSGEQAARHICRAVLWACGVNRGE
jgi:hypothetical protein